MSRKFQLFRPCNFIALINECEFIELMLRHTGLGIWEESLESEVGSGAIGCEIAESARSAGWK